MHTNQPSSPPRQPPVRTTDPGGDRLIDLTLADHAWRVIEDIAQLMATTIPTLDPETVGQAARDAADTGIEPVPPPAPTWTSRPLPGSPLTYTMLGVHEHTLASSLVELAHHLVTATLRDGAAPHLMGEVVARAVDHFHPTAMIAALETEDDIDEILARLAQAEAPTPVSSTP